MTKTMSELLILPELPAGRQVDASEAIRAVRVAKLERDTSVKLKAPRTLSKEQWPPNYDYVYAWRAKQREKLSLRPHLVPFALEYYRTHPIEFINHWCDTHLSLIHISEPTRLLSIS